MAQVFSSTKTNNLNDLLANAIKSRTSQAPVLPPLQPGTMRTTTPITTNKNIAPAPLDSYLGLNDVSKVAQQKTPIHLSFKSAQTPISTETQESYTPTYSGGSSYTQPTVSSNYTPAQPIPTTSNPNSGLYGQITNNLANINNDKATGATKDIYNLQKEYADKALGLKRKGLSIGYGTGAANLLQQNYNDRLAAEEQGLANALKIGDQNISGLSAAGGFAAPTSVAPGNTLTNPLTGETVAGGLGGYANYQTAQQVFSQAGQYKDAVNSQGQPFTYNEAMTPQQNWQTFATQYLPNSRTYQSSLNNAGLSSNIGQQGGGNPLAESTVNNANIQGYNQTYQAYKDLNAQYDGAKNLGSLLVKTMQEGGLNTADPKILNYTINQIKSQLSDKDFQKFNSTLANVQSAYANILATGGGTIPTAATNALHMIIDPNSSFGAIQAAINQLNQEVVTGKLTPLSTQVNSYLGNIGGGQSGSGGGNNPLGI